MHFFMVIAIIITLCFVCSVHALIHTPAKCISSTALRNTRSWALSAKKKSSKGSGSGFGKPSIAEKSNNSNAAQAAAVVTGIDNSYDSKIGSVDIGSSSISSGNSIDGDGDSDKKVAQYMYENVTVKRERILEEKIRILREREAIIEEDVSVGAVPELVANRMIKRIIGFFGIPVAIGMIIFISSVVAAKKYDVVVPPYIIAYATQAPFVLGLVGISYAILSSSWDEEDGSLFGISEFQVNLQRIKDGFSREKETAMLKDEIEMEKTKLRKK